MNYHKLWSNPPAFKERILELAEQRGTEILVEIISVLIDYIVNCDSERDDMEEKTLDLLQDKPKT